MSNAREGSPHIVNDTTLYRPHRLHMYPVLTTFGIFGAGCWLQVRVNKKHIFLQENVN